MDGARPKAVPVTLLAGFLGAGKTTLLNQLLGAAHGLRIAVLINDFGELSVDGELVLHRTADTITLTNGCVCCSIRGDLVEAVRNLLRRPDPPDRIVIELSGLSEPGSVLGTVEVMQRSWPLNLDGVVALVDAEQFPEAGHPNHLLARQQLALADLIVLNKVDLVEQRRVTELSRQVTSWVPTARLTTAAFAQLPVELLLGGFAERGTVEQPAPAGPLAHGFHTFSYVASAPLALERLRELVTELPPAVFRAKGVVRLDARPEHKTVVQVVGRRARIDLGPLWGEQRPETRIVFLASTEDPDLDVDGLRRRFDACRASGKRSGTAGFGAFLRRYFGGGR